MQGNSDFDHCGCKNQISLLAFSVILHKMMTRKHNYIWCINKFTAALLLKGK